MLERIEHDNGVILNQSPLLRELGVVHGFTTRVGGVSDGPYATLNLAELTKDPATDANTAVAENFRRVRQALGCPRMPRVVVRQVHGGEVWVPPDAPVSPAHAPEADAIVTDRPGKLLTVRVADCVPILLAAVKHVEGVDKPVVAAVHAGWRGVVANVVAAAVTTMQQQFYAQPTRMVAAIGPHIGVNYFEVGPEVAEAFAAAGLGDSVHHDIGVKPHIDLGQAVRRQLEGAGVGAERIDASEHCTYRDQALFFSHRRDAGRTGRQAGVIAIR